MALLHSKFRASKEYNSLLGFIYPSIPPFGPPVASPSLDECKLTMGVALNGISRLGDHHYT